MARTSTKSAKHDEIDEESGLRPSEVEGFAARLTEYHDELRARHASHMAPPRAGDGTHSDDMDGAAAAQDNSLSLALAEKERALITEIEAALARIAEGTYGICEGTGEPIGKKRLDARPWSRHSVVHQEQCERSSRMLSRAAS